MRIFVWLLRAAVFFVLFAFALNNQHDSTVHWFFGLEWRAPMVFVVLAAFAAGCAVGVVAMLPGWWQHHRAARAPGTADATPAAGPAPAAPRSELAPSLPPRDGL